MGKAAMEEAPLTKESTASNLAIASLVLGVVLLACIIGLSVYFARRLNRPAAQAAQANQAVAVDPSSGRLTLLPQALAPSCAAAECSAQTAGTMCLADASGPLPVYNYCTGSNGQYAWGAPSPLVNGPMLLANGASIGGAFGNLSHQLPGTVLVGGPDFNISPGFSSNSNMWLFWRGVDNLVYANTLTPEGASGTSPVGACDPATGACDYCRDASGNIVYNCCTPNSGSSTFASNICDLVNYQGPNGTTNLCSPWGTTAESAGCASQ